MTTLAPAPPAPARHAAASHPSFLRHSGTLAGASTLSVLSK